MLLVLIVLARYVHCRQIWATMGNQPHAFIMLPYSLPLERRKKKAGIFRELCNMSLLIDFLTQTDFHNRLPDS